ncbi:hypothetical protein [Treponema pectinovorum]|uniref:hypothetical protein n=1 Tax=Treponema pectinovorum TaxID=164 RepID=UPI0011C857C0|nr:hypothetical protein [Treponema pectinovorum]
MKKFFSFGFIIFIFFTLRSFALERGINLPYKNAYENSQDYLQDVPSSLQGVWQGRDRLILFSGKESRFSCVLRVFYSWYNDRASEESSYSQISSRDRNNTTSSNPENIEISFKTFVETSSKNEGCYSLCVKYPSQKEMVYIPLAKIEDKIYLNFFLRQNYSLEDEAPINEKYFLLDMGTSSGITISPPVIKKELLCYFVDGSSVYSIRYWLCDVENTKEIANFSDDEKTFQVPKYIQTSGRLYTCTTGRSKKIRNVQKSSSLPYDFVVDKENKIYAYGNPYLVFVPGSKNQEQLQKIVEENNSKRHPPVRNIFPVNDIDFHWKEINELEKYNPYTWNKRNLDIHK